MTLKESWAKNRGTILILLFALLACMYTIATAKQYQAQCNTHWIAELEKMYDECQCVQCQPKYNDYEQFNNSYSLNIMRGTKG